MSKVKGNKSATVGSTRIKEKSTKRSAANGSQRQTPIGNENMFYS